MAEKNISKRTKRRYKRRLKTSVKIGIVAFIFFVIMGAYIGIRVYQLKNYVNPFGEVDKKEDEVEDDLGTIEVAASYDILDVGAGEAILAKCGSFEALIDTGPKGSEDKLMKALEGKVTGKLDYLILTSPTEGRTGGIETVVNSFNVDTVIIGDFGDEKDAVLRRINGKASSFEDGVSSSFDFGEGATLFIIKPEVSSSDAGDRSLVTYFKVDQKGFIAFSDAGKEEVARALSGIERCDVIVFPQYGQSEAVPKIEEQISAAYYIASTGKDSDFPSEELQKQYYNKIFTTSENGTITFTVNNGDVASSLDNKGTGSEKDKEEEKEEDSEGDDSSQ